MKVETISIGNEIIYGRIVDTNVAYISKQLCEEGMQICYHTVVGDFHNKIKEALSIAVGRSDIIVTTGGLGPTKDDITRQVIADLTKNNLVLHKKSLDDITAKFCNKGINMPANNKVQAMIPQGAEVIYNKIGTAPGTCITFKDKKIISLPGVPSEMKLMVKDWVMPHIREFKKGLPANNETSNPTSNAFMLIKDINTYGEPESLLGEKIQHLMGQNKNPVVGTQASIDGIKVRLCANASTREEAVKILNDTANKVKQSLGETVYGEDDKRLQDAVFDLLRKHNLTIATAESCTGGLVANLLTNVPGISEFFLEGIVAYSNEAKIKILNVPEDILIEHGAVSSQVASAMASGVRKHANSDIGIGITGIAGPSGETADKPVGLVYIAVDIKGTVDVKRYLFSGNRINIKKRSALFAINMLRIRLLNL